MIDMPQFQVGDGPVKFEQFVNAPSPPSPGLSGIGTQHLGSTITNTFQSKAQTPLGMVLIGLTIANGIYGMRAGLRSARKSKSRKKAFTRAASGIAGLAVWLGVD